MVGDLFEQAGAEFGSNSPLTAMHKLVKLSQMTMAMASVWKIDSGVLLRQTAQALLLPPPLGVDRTG